MTRKAKGAGFKMRSGGSTSFKMMGSSPVKLETPSVAAPPSAEDILSEQKNILKGYRTEGVHGHQLLEEFTAEDPITGESQLDIHGPGGLKDFLKKQKKNIKTDIKAQKKIVKTEQKEAEIKNLYELIMSEDSPRGNALRGEVMRLRRFSGETGSATGLGWDHHGKKEGILEEDAPTSGKVKIPKKISEYAFNLYKGKIKPKVIQTHYRHFSE